MCADERGAKLCFWLHTVTSIPTSFEFLLDESEVDSRTGLLICIGLSSQSTHSFAPRERNAAGLKRKGG